MSLDTVRLSQQGKDQLVKVKRATGIKQWNVLCRWALCASLADSTPPLVREVTTDSNVEMSWRAFGGEYGPVYAELVRRRAALENLDEYQVLLAHLHLGIGELAGQSPKSIADLIGIAVPTG